MLHLVPMPLTDLPDAYRSMEREFPDQERKPLPMLRQQYRAGKLDLWWLMEGEVRRGYAILLRCPGEELVLLDYLAMLDKGRGFGTACLGLLQQEYPGILVEAEAELPGLSPEEIARRERRLRFYERSGFRPCTWQAEVFGVVYQLFGWFAHPQNRFDERCRAGYTGLYGSQLPAPWLAEHFRILEGAQ